MTRKVMPLLKPINLQISYRITMNDVFSTEYKIHIDFLRIAACLLVIINHTNSRIFMGHIPSPVWFVSVTLFFISKTAVPVFIMISGALLLGRDESYKKFFGRVLRIAAVLILFSFFYFIISVKDFAALTGADIKDFLMKLYGSAVTNTFWYLYLYIGLLLMLPLLRKLTTGFKQKDYIYFICCSVLITFIIPVVTDLFSLPHYNATVITPLFNGYLAYFVFGHYIENEFNRMNRRYFIAAAALFILFTAFSVIMTYFEFSKNTYAYPYWDNRVSFNIMIPSVCLFYMAKYLSGFRYSDRIKTAVKISGSCTFGIYLLSDMLIEKLEPMYGFMVKYIGRFPAVLILIIAVFFAGYTVVYYLRKIPALKQLI